MRVIVGDPLTGVLEEREFPAATDDFMEACRSFVDAPFLDMMKLEALRDHGIVVAWVDEEGLGKPAAGFWSPIGAPAPIAGRFVLTNVDDDGEPSTLLPSLDEVAPVIHMHAGSVHDDDDDLFPLGEFG